ncbi:MAG: tetratricopeptide repeat protein [Isosphaeraceae bacterium]
MTILEVLPSRTGTISRVPIDPGDSLSRITAQIRKEPWRFDLHSARAAMLLASGHTERAARDWLYLVSSGRAYGETYLSLALESLRARKFDQALHYVKAAAVQPDSDPSESTRTVWQLAQAGAKGEHQVENGFAALADYARWLTRERRLDDAAVQFDRLVGENPRSGRALLDRGEFYQRLGMVDRARADFERALALDEIGAEFKLELILREEALGRTAPSHFSVCHRSVDVDPTSTECHTRYAEMLVADGVPGHALAVLERAVDQFGERPELLVPLAKLYRDFGYPLKAERLFRTVLSQHPRNADALIGVDRCAELERPPSY